MVQKLGHSHCRRRLINLFTGSSRDAEKLVVDLKGRLKLEDVGFDWKIIGLDVEEVDYVAWVCDQDAYARDGQKCSAQSIIFVHEHWKYVNLVPKLRDLAERIKLEDLIVSHVLTVKIESFWPHQILTNYRQDQLQMMLDTSEKIHAQITAASLLSPKAVQINVEGSRNLLKIIHM